MLVFLPSSFFFQESPLVELCWFSSLNLIFTFGVGYFVPNVLTILFYFFEQKRINYWKVNIRLHLVFAGIGWLVIFWCFKVGLKILFALLLECKLSVIESWRAWDKKWNYQMSRLELSIQIINMPWWLLCR